MGSRRALIEVIATFIDELLPMCQVVWYMHPQTALINWYRYPHKIQAVELSRPPDSGLSEIEIVYSAPNLLHSIRYSECNSLILAPCGSRDNPDGVTFRLLTRIDFISSSIRHLSCVEPDFFDKIAMAIRACDYYTSRNRGCTIATKSDGAGVHLQR